jgi:hypothetical protein
MGFDSLFRRATFGRKEPTHSPGSSMLPPPLRDELQRLDLYRRGLGGDAIGYVATGDNRIVLDAIVALGKATPIYAAPYHKDHAAKGAAERATNLGLVTGTVPAGPEIGRLMAVRHAVGAYHLPYSPVPPPPEKVPVMALYAAIEAGLSASQVNYAVPWETLIPLDGLLRLVRGSGGGMADLFHFILRRDATRFLTAGSWHASETFGEFIDAEPAAFAQALLSAEPRCRAWSIALAEHHCRNVLPEFVAALVAMLTRPFDKQDRELAISALARLEEAQLLDLLERELAGADIDTRFGLVQAAGRNGGAELLVLLGDRDKVEKAAKVKAAIHAVLEAGQPALSPGAAETQGETGYAAIDGSFVAIPPMTDLGDEEAPSPSDEECFAFMDCIEAIDAQRAEQLAKQVPGRGDRSQHLQPLTREEIEGAFAVMTEGTPMPAGLPYTLLWAVREREDGRAWYRAILDRLPLAVALHSIFAQGNGEIGRLMTVSGYANPNTSFLIATLRGWMEEGRVGMRELVTTEHSMALARAATQGRETPDFDPVGQLRISFGAPDYSRDYRSPLKALPVAAVWPWLAENLGIFDEAFGLQPASKPIVLERALAALELLPAVPQRYLAKLTEMAVTEKRPIRRKAMALLRNAQQLEQRVAALLDDARQQVRIHAAAWLADLRAETGEAALRKRLKKEKSDPVRTSLIEALQRLGADLSDVIGPASLLAEAEKAIAKAAPELPAWLAASGVPAVRFRDGTTLPEPVLRHWLALAIRLKDPGATGQFGIYLDQLDPADAQALSGWVLESWIEFDTRTASLDQANAYAVANYATDWRWMCRTQTPELRDQIIAEIRQRKLGEMLNSGSDTKGVLALACRAEPVWAANRVRGFLKKHGRRSHQAMALLDVLAGIGVPAALQVVIAASTRLKQKSTQAHAADIAARYAEDRGWSFDELADRTVPAAGFDDDGELELPCGEDGKLYTARLDAALAIHLFNPDGKPVKSLPAGDDEASKESAKALSTAKKELKQVIELQGGRLFEAMCVERSWPIGDWRTAFHEHPVMRRLVERLVWQGLDAEGQPQGLFRPTQEGDFTDAADEPVDVDAFARVRLAHGALADAETCRAWTAHLKDYEVSPFIAQFGTVRAPLSADGGEAESVTDRTGWCAPSLSFRGVAEKRGYERVMRDSGGCHEYVKAFPSHCITATIWHSGSGAVDENNRIALKELSFQKAGQYGAFRLKDVPPVMLAECRADYHAVAAKGAFDPDWEKSTGW